MIIPWWETPFPTYCGLQRDVPLLVLEKETRVQRASIRRFIVEKQSLRLNVANTLAI